MPGPSATIRFVVVFGNWEKEPSFESEKSSDWTSARSLFPEVPFDWYVPPPTGTNTPTSIDSDNNSTTRGRITSK